MHECTYCVCAANTVPSSSAFLECIHRHFAMISSCEHHHKSVSFRFYHPVNLTNLPVDFDLFSQTLFTSFSFQRYKVYQLEIRGKMHLTMMHKISGMCPVSWSRFNTINPFSSDISQSLQNTLFNWTGTVSGEIDDFNNHDSNDLHPPLISYWMQPCVWLQQQWRQLLKPLCQMKNWLFKLRIYLEIRSNCDLE